MLLTAQMSRLVTVLTRWASCSLETMLDPKIFTLRRNHLVPYTRSNPMVLTAVKPTSKTFNSLSLTPMAELNARLDSRSLQETPMLQTKSRCISLRTASLSMLMTLPSPSSATQILAGPLSKTAEPSLALLQTTFWPPSQVLVSQERPLRALTLHSRSSQMTQMSEVKSVVRLPDVTRETAGKATTAVIEPSLTSRLSLLMTISLIVVSSLSSS